MMTMDDMYAFDRSHTGGGIRHVIGVDEAGRGALAGPIVAAAVMLCPNDPVAGLGDSKTLSALRREQLKVAITQQALAIGIGIVDAPCIDERGIQWANKVVMFRALRALQQTDGLNVARDDTIVLIDGTQTAFRSPWPQLTVRSGDKMSAAIAAASIIAKTHRDQFCIEVMHDDYPQYGFDRHKAYGTAAHYKALDEWGPCRFHRRSYRLS